MGEHREPAKSILRQRRWQVGFAIIILFLLYTLGGFYLLPWVLQTQAEKRLPEVLLRPVAISRICFNPFTLQLQIGGFTVKGTTAKKNLLKIDSLRLDFAGFLSLSNRALVLERLDIQGPYFAVIKNRDLSYNFSDILKALTTPSPEAGEVADVSENPTFRFSLNNITISGGFLEFDDNSTDTVHKVTDIAISLPWISNFPQLIEDDVEPSFSAVINGTPLTANGTSKPFKHSLETHFAINLDKLNLPYYLSYLPGERNFNLSAGTLSTRLDLIYVQPKDSRPRLTLQGSVTINDFMVSGKGQEKDYRFISFPELVIRLGSGNLLAGEIFFDEVVCRKPEIDFLHRPDGVYYLPMLIAAASAEDKKQLPTPGNPAGDQPDDESAGELIFKLAKIRLEDGIIRVYDKRVQPNFSTRFSPVNIRIENFSTVAGNAAQYDFQLKSDLGETLSLAGDFSLYPLQVKTHFVLQDLPLPEYVPYYKNYFAGRFRGSRLGLQGDVAVTKTAGGEIRMNLHDFACELDDCKLRTPDGKPLLDLPRFTISRGEIDFDKHECVIGALKGERGSLSLIRRKNGALNFGDLLPAPVGTPRAKAEDSLAQKESGSNPNPDSPTAETTDKPWHLLLAQGHLENFSVNFSDQVPAAATTLQVDKMNLSLSQIGTGKDESGKIKFDLRLARKGTLALDGAVVLNPLRAEFDFDLKKLPLPILQNYLADYLKLKLVNGNLTTKGHFLFAEDPALTGKFNFAGNLVIDKLKTVAADRSGELFDWHHLELDRLVYSSQPPALSLERVLSEGLNVNLIKDPDGITNFAKTVPQNNVSEKTVPAENASPAFPQKTQTLPINIKKLELRDSRFTFVDHSLLPSVDILLDDFSGSVTGINSSGGKPAEVDLTGKLNNQAVVSVTGAVNPFPENLLVDLQVKGEGVGLTSVSPYSGKYVGYAISKGKVSFDLDYQVKDNKLVAANNIFIDQFDFGSSVDSPEALHLPVKMAVSLLRNRQGEIDLNLPVSGDLSDPEFSIGGIIVKVFVNLITKAVTSPFALIGSLAGGGADLNLITFPVAGADLDAEAQQRLEKLAKVLYDRPGLKVEISGHAVLPEDRETLQNERFLKLLQLQKMKELGGKNPAEKVSDLKIEKTEFKDYLWLAYKAAPIKKATHMLGIIKKIDPAEQERLLRNFVKVSDDELLDLAAKRARTVMNFLLEKGSLEAKRLFLVTPQIVSAGAAKGNQVELKIK